MRKYILVFLVLVLMFGGLKNVKELNEIAIVKSVGIDLDEDGKLVLSAIIADTSKKENAGEGIIYKGKGNSVHEAARSMVDISPKRLYIGHLGALIISQEVAQKCFENTLDYFIRDNEGSNSFYLFIAKDNTAEEVIEIINKEKIDTRDFLKSTQKYKGNANLDTLNDNIKDIIEEGTQLCVNSFTISNDRLKISDMAFFNGWEMMGFLNGEESVLYNILMNKAESFIISYGEKDDLILADVFSSKTKISVDKVDKECINIELNLKANVTETGKNITLDNEEKISVAEEYLKEKIKNNIEEFYLKIKNEYKSDILNIGNLLYRKKNKLFYEPNYLDKLKLNVKVELNISSQGGVKKVW